MCAQCPDVTMGNTVDILSAGCKIGQMNSSAKICQFKKKRLFRPKKQAGAELEKKKKNWQKIDQFKKKWTFWTKKTS